MKISPFKLVAGSLLVLVAAELAPVSSVHIGFISEAQAIVGAPLTPVSVAGVARRTTRRAVVATSATVAATSTAAATTAAASTAAAQSAAAPPPPAGAPLAIGTIVGTLPAGCVSAPISGIEYYLCNGTYFRPTFQGNNLVYVVQQP